MTVVVTRPRLPVACWEIAEDLDLRIPGSILVRVLAPVLRFFILVAEPETETLEDRW